MARVTFFLLLVATSIFLGASIKDVVGEPVFDANGDQLFSGSTYYIGPLSWSYGGGGGLSIAKRRDDIWAVKQESSCLDEGYPWSIKPWSTKEDVITASEPLTISTGRHNYWKVTSSNDGMNYVTIDVGPLATYSSNNTLFQIKSVSMPEMINAYKIVYCSESMGICSNLGVSGRKRWLEVSKTPSIIKFIKAEMWMKKLEELK